ncbi:MAG: hypothetical protein Q8R55_04560 [Candidatus Taylorbacteria bacterium]|nr:hypothetical protein [Candidatus Taylorbacteria bacterium]
MAVDVVSEPSEKLKKVLSIHNRIDKLSRELGELNEEERLIRTTLRQHDSYVVNENIYNLTKRVVQLEACLRQLPQLCTYCNGKQSGDHSVSGQMARICSVCKGTGFQKG